MFVYVTDIIFYVVLLTLLQAYSGYYEYIFYSWQQFGTYFALIEHRRRPTKEPLCGG